MAANDVNGTLVNQYGPFPTTGVGVGGTVTMANSLVLQNFYTVGVGGSKQNTTTNFLGQILLDTP